MRPALTTVMDVLEAEWAAIKDGPLKLKPEDLARFKSHFTTPAYDGSAASDTGKLNRVQAALLMLMACPEYQVQK